MLDARLLEPANRRFRSFSNAVAELQPPEQTLAFGHQHDRRAATGTNCDLFFDIIGNFGKQFFHQVEVANGHGLTVQVAHQAQPGKGAHVLDIGAGVTEVFLSSMNGSCERVSGFHFQR